MMLGPAHPCPSVGNIVPGIVPEFWRVGKKVGRTLYINDKIVGLVDTPELAARIVKAMNVRNVGDK